MALYNYQLSPFNDANAAATVDRDSDNEVDIFIFSNWLDILLLFNNFFLHSKSNADNKYSSSVSREIQPWPDSYEKPSDLYNIIVSHGQHPPLMQPRSWSLAVPYKEQKYSHTPSESIANNYTPSANNLNIKQLSKRVRPRYRNDGFYRGGNLSLTSLSLSLFLSASSFFIVVVDQLIYYDKKNNSFKFSIRITLTKKNKSKK